MADQPPKIVKKIFKKGGHGHHGGAWKIAYADFVTAMMAIFLLMWLISSVSVEQKQGIADYFAPSMVNLESRAGNNGMLAGQNVMGENNSDMRGLGNNEEQNDVQQETVTTFFSKTEVQSDQRQKEKKQEVSTSKQAAESQTQEQQAPQDTSDRKSQKDEFDKVQTKIRQSINQNAHLRKYTANVIFDATEEGLNIIITDQEDVPMFPAGSYEMYDRMRDLLKEISSIIKESSNQIGISGHTEAQSFASTKSYTNWELSADRANSTRRALLEFGVPESKLDFVRGKEAREPYDVQNPSAIINRRVDITLLKPPVNKK